MRLAGATLPVLLLAVVFARLAPEEGRSEALFSLLFATPLLAYSLLLFAHALVAACLFGAWAALFAPARGRSAVAATWRRGPFSASRSSPSTRPRSRPSSSSPSRRGELRRASSGSSSEGFLSRPFSPPTTRACFGSPFRLSSGLEKDPSFRELARQGLFGVGLPRPAILARLLLDPSKGLLVFTPLLLLLPSGLAAARRRLPPRASPLSSSSPSRSS